MFWVKVRFTVISQFSWWPEAMPPYYSYAHSTASNAVHILYFHFHGYQLIKMTNVHVCAVHHSCHTRPETNVTRKPSSYPGTGWEEMLEFDTECTTVRISVKSPKPGASYCGRLSVIWARVALPVLIRHDRKSAWVTGGGQKEEACLKGRETLWFLTCKPAFSNTSL